jgi:tetratricopeptide (TPR) repeat protein
MSARLSRIFAAVALSTFALPHAGAAQANGRSSVDSLVSVGDLAAQESRHRVAIQAYERAIALDSSRRSLLLPRLGRQYLWSDESRQAARLFVEYLAARPSSCETKLDLGLALSWANDLDSARVTYDDVAANCLYERGEARLGAARVLRWGNRFSEAKQRYRAVMADGTDKDREQAAIGLAYVHLAQAEPRAALALADSVIRAGSIDPSAVEARVMAIADLGALGSAVDVVHAERVAGRGSASMDRLAQGYQDRARPNFSIGGRGFRDQDGTTYRAADLGSAAAPLALGTIRMSARAAELRGDSAVLQSREAEASIDLRPAAALALLGRAGIRSYDGIDFSPWDGEVDLVWLPGDHHRVDIAAARLLITDNVAAIQNGLTGTFGSVGLTERLTSQLTTAVSVDATRWSEGNTRLRVRATPRFAFEGVPSVTLEWPTTYQHYSAPFEFRFFSPREYLETGPALNLSQRVAAAWYLSLYARAGGLRESDRDWQALGIGRASLEREIRSHWGIRVDAGWSNSNLAGSAGFRRTSLAAGVTIRP